jgi:hypothetical protein
MSKLMAQVFDPTKGKLTTTKGEEWNVIGRWFNSDKEVVWYETTTVRDGVTFSQVFSPEEVTKYDQET